MVDGTIKYEFMSKELRENVEKLILHDISPLYREVLNRIDESLAPSEFAPWLVAAKTSEDGCKIILELPDEGFDNSFEDFTVSDKFIKRVSEKYGYTEQFIKDQLRDSAGNGEVLWDNAKGGYYHPSRGLWVDCQMGSHIRNKLGDDMYNAFQRVVRMMADQENWKMAYGRFKDRLERGVPMADARIIPRYDSVKDNPNLHPAEDITKVLGAKEKFAITQCPCRIRNQEADIDWDLEVCAATNEYAELLIRHEHAYEVTRDELFEKLQASGRKIPMCHIRGFAGLDVTSFGNVQCNCHQYACAVGRHTVRTGGEFKIWQVLQKSRYRAVIDETKCIKCGKCMKDRCMFDAILPHYYKSVGKELLYIFETQCMGCGCCVETCPTSAISMKCVDPVEALLGYNYDANGDPVFKEPELSPEEMRKQMVVDF